VPNVTDYSVAGKLSKGGIAAETQTDKTFFLTFKETIDFLEPQKERVCSPIPNTTICAENPPEWAVKVTLPARAGAICRSAEDYSKIKTVLDQACRDMGASCTYEIQQAIDALAR
jgi:hypothetical protein